MAASGRDLMLALSEVGGMVVKAARGAGIALGQAEDLGRVAVYLAGTSGDVRPITHALKEPQSPATLDWQADHVTIRGGAAALIAPIIADAFAMGYDSATLASLEHAPLVGVFLAERGTALRWEGRTLYRSDTTVLSPSLGPVIIPETDWTIWNAFAANTYVPETEESRLAGAGAGLTDND